MSKKPKFYYITIFAYTIIPIICSTISSIHIIRFFELSNYFSLALILAISAEIGALSGLFGITSFGKVNKGVIWFIFIFLTLYQIIGNVYFSYDVLSEKLNYNSNFIKSFIELFGFDIYDESDTIVVKRIISFIEGVFLPITSLCFLHLLVSYVSNINKNELLNQKLEEDLKEYDNETNNSNEDNSHYSENKNEQKTENIEKIKEGQENKEQSKNISEDGFNDFLEKKKKRLEKDRTNYSELLKILYREGTAQKGEELPTYKEFVKIVDNNKYNSDTIKTFLTLLNYLDIIKANKEQKIALKSFEDAQNVLESYLSFGM